MKRFVGIHPAAVRKCPGFTLIEMLVVALILGILMIVAMPTYKGAVADSQHRDCRANMQAIANAEQSYHTSNLTRVYTTDLTAASPLITYLGGIPKCPNGGTYSITDATGIALTAASTAFTVHCTVAAHEAPYVAGEPNGYTLNVNTQ